MTFTRVKRVSKSAWLTSRRSEARVDRDPYYVAARWDWRLSVASVKHKVLPSELPNIHIRPAFADSLVAWFAGRATGQEFSVVIIWAGVRAILLNIYHAEASLSCAPNESGNRVDQLIERVVPEMEMLVTGGELEESIVCSDVIVRVAYNEIAISYVWC